MLRNDSKTEETKDEVTINTKKKNRNIEYEEHWGSAKSSKKNLI